MYASYQVSVRQATISLSLLLAHTSQCKPWESLWGSSATTSRVDFHHRCMTCPSYQEKALKLNALILIYTYSCLSLIAGHFPMQRIELFVAQRIARLPLQNCISGAILSLSTFKNHISDPSRVCFFVGTKLTIFSEKNKLIQQILRPECC